MCARRSRALAAAAARARRPPTGRRRGPCASSSAPAAPRPNRAAAAPPPPPSRQVAAIDTADGAGAVSTLATPGGARVVARLVALASGQAAGRFLKYEEGAPAVAAQTAYGIEAEVEGCAAARRALHAAARLRVSRSVHGAGVQRNRKAAGPRPQRTATTPPPARRPPAAHRCPAAPRSYGGAYDPDAMVFMDYRRHHTGVWEGSAPRLNGGNHPNANDGLWGSAGEVRAPCRAAAAAAAAWPVCAVARARPGWLA